MNVSTENLMKILLRLWFSLIAGIGITVILSYDLTTGVAIWSKITPVLYLAWLVMTTAVVMSIAFDLTAFFTIVQNVFDYVIILIDKSMFIWTSGSKKSVGDAPTDRFENDNEFELPIEAEDLLKVNVAGLPDTKETALEVAKIVLLTQLPEEVQSIIPCIEGDIASNPTIISLRNEIAEDERHKFDAMIVSLDYLESSKMIIKTNGTKTDKF
jgi:hypothetical protein